MKVVVECILEEGIDLIALNGAAGNPEDEAPMEIVPGDKERHLKFTAQVFTY